MKQTTTDIFDVRFVKLVIEVKCCKMLDENIGRSLILVIGIILS